MVFRHLSAQEGRRLCLLVDQALLRGLPRLQNWDVTLTLIFAYLVPYNGQVKEVSLTLETGILNVLGLIDFPLVFQSYRPQPDPQVRTHCFSEFDILLLY